MPFKVVKNDVYPIKIHAMRHIETIKSWFTSIEDIQKEIYHAIYNNKRTLSNQTKIIYQIALRNFLNKK